jgi:hypothetical protein
VVSRLSDEEVALFDAVSATDARHARFAHSRLMPPGVSGITFGHLVVIRNGISTTERPDLYLHELVHVEQYRIHGMAKFLLRYLREYVVNLWRLRSHRQSYLAIPFEREARERVEGWAEQRRSS